MNMGRDRREPSLDGLNQRTQAIEFNPSRLSPIWVPKHAHRLDGLNQRTQACLSMMRVTDRGGGSSIMTTLEP